MKKKKMILIGALSGLALVVLWVLFSGGRSATVETTDVRLGDLETYAEETATVCLKSEASIYALQSGRITELADTGSILKAGDVLAKMDDTELALQIKALEAQREAVAAQYEQAGKTNSERIKQLQALVNTAEITYTDAKRALDNTKALYDAGYASYDEYQAALSGLSNAEAGVKTAKSSLAIEQQGMSESVTRQYEARLSEIQAQIDIYTKKYEEMTIRAPFDGIVLKKSAVMGSFAAPGTLMFLYGGNDGFYLESSILTDDIAKIKVGALVLISNEDLGIKDAKGSVSKIFPIAVGEMSELGIEQKRVKVEITLDGDIPGVMSGYEMDIKIVTGSKKGVLTVDKKAVFDYNGSPHVFIADNGAAKLCEIKTGLEDDERVEVTEGLKEGQQVVLSPDEDLEDGMKIKTAR